MRPCKPSVTSDPLPLTHSVVACWPYSCSCTHQALCHLRTFALAILSTCNAFSTANPMMHIFMAGL